MDVISLLIDFFSVTETAIPIWQIMMLLFLSTMTLLFGRVKLALLINYLFTLNWGYLSNQKIIFENIEQIEYVATIYFGVGALLAAAGFMLQK
jgi:hypothetical protein